MAEIFKINYYEKENLKKALHAWSDFYFVLVTKTVTRIKLYFFMLTLLKKKKKFVFRKRNQHFAKDVIQISVLIAPKLLIIFLGIKKLQSTLATKDLSLNSIRQATHKLKKLTFLLENA